MMYVSSELAKTLFYIWWLAVNCFLAYVEYGLFVRFTDIQMKDRSRRFLYIAANCALTFFALYLPLPGFVKELLHGVLLCLVPMALLRLKWTEVIAPAAILFTLSTFMEGMSAAVMGLLVVRIPDPVTGNVVHMILTAALALLFFYTIQIIVRRYVFVTRKGIVPYLYILLLPCTFVVWVIRFGFGLDSAVLFPSRAPFAEMSPLWIIGGILSAFATFFVILEVFDRILVLSGQETEKALLHAQLQQQRIYLDEARKRDDGYRAFQHDINNHLIVLSGLIQDKKYRDAEKYFIKINAAAGVLQNPVSTGNCVLDVLLREKMRYAEQNSIVVSCEIQLPPELVLDDMDLCIVASNALDNAIQACLNEESGENKIKIAARVRHRLLLIQVTNTCHCISPVIPDTGMKNMKRIAEKYQGTLDFEKGDGEFRLSVLLCCN